MFSLLRIITAMPILLVFFGLSACGQKGPLFLAPQSVPFTLLPGSQPSAPAASPTGSSPTPAVPTPAAK